MRDPSGGAEKGFQALISRPTSQLACIPPAFPIFSPLPSSLHILEVQRAFSLLFHPLQAVAAPAVLTSSWLFHSSEDIPHTKPSNLQNSSFFSPDFSDPAEERRPRGDGTPQLLQRQTPGQRPAAGGDQERGHFLTHPQGKTQDCFIYYFFSNQNLETTNIRIHFTGF